MPRFGSRVSAATGVYRWVAELLAARHGRPDPRTARPATASAPTGAVTVPAWLLDGHSARAAGFQGLVPADRRLRSALYVIGPDDTVRPAQSEV